LAKLYCGSGTNSGQTEMPSNGYWPPNGIKEMANGTLRKALRRRLGCRLINHDQDLPVDLRGDLATSLANSRPKHPDLRVRCPFLSI